MKIKYAWQRAELLVSDSSKLFDAAELALAARAIGWHITALSAGRYLHELRSYGLMEKEGGHYRYSATVSNSAPPLSLDELLVCSARALTNPLSIAKAYQFPKPDKNIYY